MQALQMKPIGRVVSGVKRDRDDSWKEVASEIRLDESQFGPESLSGLAEFSHIEDPKRRQWIAERLEGDPPQPDRAFILERLIRAEMFERVLQSRYLGNRRFSLEGSTALIPLLVSAYGASMYASKLVTPRLSVTCLIHHETR